MKFSYNLLQEYFSVKLPKPEKIAELLNKHSFEVESVENKGGDSIFSIDILPNRMPDAGGHFWLAKEIFAILNYQNLINKKDFKILNFKSQNLKYPKSQLLDIKIENFELCKRYIGAIMKNVSIKESPEWLKVRLESLGINSINNLVDAANYAMLELNQPLHIFDADKLNGKIIVRNAKHGESIITLDNKKYDLDENILIIADAKEPLAIAGIKGGKIAEVDLNTKNIIIEAANFNRTIIRKASQKLNLRTDASARFSAGLDPNLTSDATLRAISLIQSLAGGRFLGTADIYEKKFLSKTITLSLDKLNKVLGTKISLDEVKNILNSLNFKFGAARKKYNTLFKIKIPTVRQDIEIEEDLIEEIGRIYGYEKIKAVSPTGNLIGFSENNYLPFLNLIKNSLTGQGFSEVYNYSFIYNNDLELLDDSLRKDLMELENSLIDAKFLRPCLILNLLRNASLNLKNYDNFRLFELGKAYGFNKKYGEKPPHKKAVGEIMSFSKIPLCEGEFENLRLAGLIAEEEEKGKELFYGIKGSISYLLESAGITDIIFTEANSNSEFLKEFMPISHLHRSSAIKIGDEIIGFFGEVSADILRHFGIKRGKIAFFEINFETLTEKITEEKEFRYFSKFPNIIRDLSLLVPLETRVAEAQDIIENTGGILLIDSDLFDIYEGEDAKLDGKKSLAFRLIFQSEERTLHEDEIEEIIKKIIKALEENPEWEVRR